MNSDAAETQLFPFHIAALAAIRSLPEYRSLSYLELGCGDGLILEKLHSDGVQQARGTTFRERGTDYIRGRDYPEHLQVDGGIDLNRPLPYAPASFDVVYSTEVIEHIEGHRNFVLEAARVLKPGGWLVLTTPNLHRIASRFNFALSGIHFTKRSLIPWTHGPELMEEFHHRCADFPLLHWLLWKGGLRIQEMRTTEVHTISRVLLVLRPILWLSMRKHVMRHVTDEAEDRTARRDLLRWMNHPALLISEQICLTARKDRGS
jgi:SAM-dependent methyltransferase